MMFGVVGNATAVSRPSSTPRQRTILSSVALALAGRNRGRVHADRSHVARSDESCLRPRRCPNRAWGRHNEKPQPEGLGLSWVICVMKWGAKPGVSTPTSPIQAECSAGVNGWHEQAARSLPSTSTLIQSLLGPKLCCIRAFGVLFRFDNLVFFHVIGLDARGAIALRPPKMHPTSKVTSISSSSWNFAGLERSSARRCSRRTN